MDFHLLHYRTANQSTGILCFQRSGVYPFYEGFFFACAVKCVERKPVLIFKLPINSGPWVSGIEFQKFIFENIMYLFRSKVFCSFANSTIC